MRFDKPADGADTGAVGEESAVVDDCGDSPLTADLDFTPSAVERVAKLSSECEICEARGCVNSSTRILEE